MSQRAPIRFIDRASGEIREEEIYAHGFLDWSYNSRVGRLFTDLLFRRRWVSRLYGWMQRTRWSRRRIRPFIERFGIDADEIVRPVGEFESFADFFVREIDFDRREIARDPQVCIAPADGRVLAYPTVGVNDGFQIKRSRFNLRELLADDQLAARYDGGSMLITRLYICDYHHVHFPDAGVCGPAKAIGGGLYAVSPYGRRSHAPFYSENFRMRAEFESENFGRITMVEIGAFTVGSIRQRYQVDERVERADRKSVFEIGGSTVVLLFEPGRIELDEDLVSHTREGMETYVRLGDSIGR